ncbi:hypothetical protein A2Z23_02080 [Candidatus Curtissbacteria bacterium RBG_16_39_7]|uniref:Uncharacterized protein n=1 Tax=Candidatus Curtissbacteria bacterium RBG_16_39_7 TaxID=1797707 RepID=A0A1F5G1Y5_9BACT|nr:MAG: hypothetical protein A2Z23_02080 [Candidatus Curtissbacteria bacterium RBG_16_39_7]
MGFLGLGKSRREAEPRSGSRSSEIEPTKKDVTQMFMGNQISVDELEEKLTEKLRSSYAGEVELKLEVNKQVAQIWAAKIRNLGSNSKSPVDVLNDDEVLILQFVNSDKNDAELRRCFINDSYSPSEAPRMVRTVLELRKLQGQKVSDESPIFGESSWYAKSLLDRREDS